MNPVVRVFGGTGNGRSGSTILLPAIWFALLAALVELTVLGIKRFVFHRLVFVGVDVVWMTPLAYAGLLVAAGLLLLVIARRWPAAASVRVTVFVFVALGALSLLLMVPRLHRVAALLLASGLAVQGSRLAAARPDALRTMVRRTVGPLLVAVVLLTLGTLGSQTVRERRALGRLRVAGPDLPNVLLVVLDTVRAPSLSLYGYHRPTTPQLQRYVRGGVRFDRAFSTSPWTLPSHGTMFTGRFPHELSAGWWRPLDARYPTLAELLAAQGYETAGFVANTLYCGSQCGLSRGFAHYEDYAVSPGEVFRAFALGRAIDNSEWLRDISGVHQLLGRKTAADVNRALLRWLDQHDPHRPFFAFLNYYDAHRPYLPPEGFARRFSSKIPRGHHERGEALSPEEARELRDAYDGAIAYIDRHLGLLLSALRQRGVLDDTLVVITSDHGEGLGEHRLFGHGNSLYRSLLHVPLLIVFPGRVPAGEIVTEAVSLRDLAATVVDLAGLGGTVPVPGASLARYWAPTRPPPAEMLLAEVDKSRNGPKWYPVMKGSMKSLVGEGRHYIKNEGDGREELYDFDADPWEVHDLASAADSGPTLEHFRLALAAQLTPSLEPPQP
jgi:arylsulfatase A-like enzyme